MPSNATYLLLLFSIAHNCRSEKAFCTYTDCFTGKKISCSKEDLVSFLHPSYPIILMIAPACLSYGWFRYCEASVKEQAIVTCCVGGMGLFYALEKQFKIRKIITNAVQEEEAQRSN